MRNLAIFQLRCPLEVGGFAAHVSVVRGLVRPRGSLCLSGCLSGCLSECLLSNASSSRKISSPISSPDRLWTVKAHARLGQEVEFRGDSRPRDGRRPGTAPAAPAIHTYIHRRFPSQGSRSQGSTHDNKHDMLGNLPYGGAADAPVAPRSGSYLFARRPRSVGRSVGATAADLNEYQQRTPCASGREVLDGS